MILSFGNSETEQVWLGNRVKKNCLLKFKILADVN